ncbi:polyprenyl synthetase family protein [Clostridium thermarum]|uniref:polyprenyl synthetase family protein n=1 Tax=Clostridium thermarum TaxID=1716543 RepID=UPI00112078C1|nr:polyprenyl synthetase family protein [Clostridium thermarum]
MNNFWNDYAQLSNELITVNNVISKNLKSRNKTMQAALSELLSSGGKFLRPAFVLISHGFGEVRSKDIHTLAAVLEMIHMATLVHDDVIDEATLRRGNETIQHKYGKNFAVYVGDYLFCLCFNLLSKIESVKNTEMDAMAMARICIGEIDQFESRFKSDVTVKKYLRRISYKTAELFSLSFYTGAIEGKCDKKLTRKLTNIGHNIGMAFQIIDDLLDFFGDEKTVGKPVCSDLKQGLYTLPVIYGFQTKDERLMELLSKGNFDDDNIKEIISILSENGCFERTRKLAHTYTEKAFKLINTLPDCDSKIVLISLTNKLLNREN